MRDLFGDEDENAKNTSDDFAKMFESSLEGVEKNLKPGDRVKGEILAIGKEEVFVSTGTTDDGVVMKLDLLNAEGVFDKNVGDVVDLFVTQVRNGQIMLSTKATAKNLAEGLEEAYNLNMTVEGRVTEAVNGGFRVEMMGKTAFCPISQIDTRRVDDTAPYIGRKFEFMITKFSGRGRDIVVSRRRLLEDQKELSQASFLETHKVGDMVPGIVTRLEQYGAFVELAPGLDGLVHISEVSWTRLAHPSEALKLGQQVSVKILKVEPSQGRMNVSLSIKQGESTPWERLPSGISEGQVVQGRVTRLMKFGAFVEVAPGLEGLVPLSEMSYTKRIMRPEEVMKEGETVAVLIKELRLDDRKMLLSLKDGQGGDPWSMVPEKFPVGSVARGRVERREPYGLFVKIDEGVVGLLPKSKALENPEFNFDKLKVGDDVTVQIGEIRLEERKISLGVPQDPDADAWRGIQAGAPSAKSLGTLADQFKGLFGADSGSQNAKSKK